MSLNRLLEHEHEVGRSNSPPKLLRVEDYADWKIRFVNYLRFTDIRMWICISEGYTAPSAAFGTEMTALQFKSMDDDQKRMYEAENRAYSSITMSLPKEILHTYEVFATSKLLWDTIAHRIEGNKQIQEGKSDLLTTQFTVFKHMAGENLEDVINRFYHLLTELKHHGVQTDAAKVKERFLEALSGEWHFYTVLIKEKAGYAAFTLDEVIGHLRAYELSLKKRNIGQEITQIPEMYGGKKPADSAFNMTRAFVSEINEKETNTESKGNQCGSSNVSTGASSNSSTGSVLPTGQNTQIVPRVTMPMSLQAAEGHVALTASFIKCYENFISGKASDPSLFDEDYDQLDADDLRKWIFHGNWPC